MICDCIKLFICIGPAVGYILYMRFKLYKSDDGTNWIWDSQNDIAIGKIQDKSTAEFIIEALNSMHEEEKPTIH